MANKTQAAKPAKTYKTKQGALIAARHPSALGPTAVEDKHFTLENVGDGWTFVPIEKQSTRRARKRADPIAAALAAPEKKPRRPRLKVEKPPMIEAKPRKRAEKKAAPKPHQKARAGGKTDQVVQLMKRKEGATAAEIMALCNWKPHSVRGFVAGTVKKRLGYEVEATDSDEGRVYRITGRRPDPGLTAALHRGKGAKTQADNAAKKKAATTAPAPELEDEPI